MIKPSETVVEIWHYCFFGITIIICAGTMTSGVELTWRGSSPTLQSTANQYTEQEQQIPIAHGHGIVQSCMVWSRRTQQSTLIPDILTSGLEQIWRRSHTPEMITSGSANLVFGKVFGDTNLDLGPDPTGECTLHPAVSGIHSQFKF